MRKLLISKTGCAKVIMAFMLPVLFLFVGGCTDSPAKINTFEPDALEPGVITMVTIADEVSFRISGKGEVYIYTSTKWVDYAYKYSLAEYDPAFHVPTFTFKWLNSESSTITIRGNVTHFVCYDNELTNINVTGMPSLLYLDCSHNPLTVLDVSKNKLLETLNCANNNLSDLDVCNNIALKYLLCYSNSLTSLDVSQNKSLNTLDCSHNQLTNLNVSNNTLLEHLSFSYNLLRNLDLSNNASLLSLVAMDNNLESLDLSINKNLSNIWIDNNLIESLDLSNNPLIKNIMLPLNKLSVVALNNLFHSLPDVSHLTRRYSVGDLGIKRNPGEDDCDKSIAEAKGWTFVDSYPFDIDNINEKYSNTWRNQ